MPELNYEKAMQELNSILEELDNQEIGVDALVAKVKRGAELIKQCRQKLTETELEVTTVLEDLEKSFEDK